jgi:hypothetical protein
VSVQACSSHMNGLLVPVASMARKCLSTKTEQESDANRRRRLLGRRRSALNELVVNREQRHFQAVRQAELVEDVRQVVLDRILAE